MAQSTRTHIIPVKHTAHLGLERALGVNDLRRLAKITKRQFDQCVGVVGIGVLINERKGEPDGGIDLSKFPGEVEGIAFRRLHLDAVTGPDVGIEFEARDGEALRPPPLRQLVWIGERREHNRPSGRQDALYLKG